MKMQDALVEKTSTGLERVGADKEKSLRDLKKLQDVNNSISKEIEGSIKKDLTGTEKEMSETSEKLGKSEERPRQTEEERKGDERSLD